MHGSASRPAAQSRPSRQLPVDVSTIACRDVRTGKQRPVRALLRVNGATDEALCRPYERADGLIMASRGEEFGLPLIEAARYGTYILARDIPVFHEIADGHAGFFSGDTPEKPAREVGRWLDRVENGRAVASSGMPCPTWNASARKFAKCIASLTGRVEPQTSQRPTTAKT